MTALVSASHRYGYDRFGIVFGTAGFDLKLLKIRLL